MSKTKNANKKNQPPEKQKQKSLPMKTSYECEQCKSKCVKGLNYIEQVKSSKGKSYKGVACHA